MDQLSLAKTFRVRGGRKGDMLWEILHSMGFTDGSSTRKSPQVEFVGNLDTVTSWGAYVVFLAVESERNEAVRAVHQTKVVDDLIFVDAPEEQLEMMKRCLSRILFNTE